MNRQEELCKVCKEADLIKLFTKGEYRPYLGHEKQLRRCFAHIKRSFPPCSFGRPTYHVLRNNDLWVDEDGGEICIGQENKGSVTMKGWHPLYFIGFSQGRYSYGEHGVNNLTSLSVYLLM
jgi:hypothetical protein